MRKLSALLMATCLFFGAGMRASAQQVLSLPAGLHRLSLSELEAAAGGTFHTMTVTLPPAPTLGRLYLDGKPVEAYRPLTREQAGRVVGFCGKGAPVSIGVSFLPQERVAPVLRIRCINPVF